MQNIIIDTDIGSDIDDAFALAYAVNNRNFNVLGVTTVYRNAAARAKLARVYLRSLGRSDIPVYAGLDNPLIQEPEKIEPPHVVQKYNESGKYIPPQYLQEMDSEPVESGNAVDYIIETVLAQPGEIVIAAIGALTNLAVAIRKEPKIILCIKEIVLMGGYFSQGVAEWNILCDPEAAHIVFSSGIKIKMVGLDVTLKCKLTSDELNRIRSKHDHAGSLLSTFLQRWFDYYTFDFPVMHDPLAICSIDTACVTFQQEKVTIGLCGDKRGHTEPDIHGTPVLVAKNVDTDLFFINFYEQVFGK